MVVVRVPELGVVRMNLPELSGGDFAEVSGAASNVAVWAGRHLPRFLKDVLRGFLKGSLLLDRGRLPAKRTRQGRTGREIQPLFRFLIIGFFGMLESLHEIDIFLRFSHWFCC